MIYRLNFVMWRVRVFLGLVTTYFLWLAVLPANGQLFGYSQNLMFTYILGTAIMSSLVLANRSYVIADDISSGNLSNFLLRPVNFFLYWFSRDIGDKAMNVIFSVVEICLVFIILKPPFIVQQNPLYVLLFIVAVFFGVSLYFLINLLLGFIGFWSSEVWAPRFILWMVISFVAGQYFPLDILPKSIFSVLELLPFSYLLYFPLKIYMGHLSIVLVLKGLVISFAWIGILSFVAFYIWKKGLKQYTAVGR